MQNFEVDIYCDGGSRGNPGISGIGVVILNTHTKQTIMEQSVYLGETTNNASEYMALIHGLQFAQTVAASRVNIYLDSLLVVNHIKGEYQVKNSRLKPLYLRVIDLLKLFGDGFTIQHIPREENTRADKLANIAMNRKY